MSNIVNFNFIKTSNTFEMQFDSITRDLLDWNEEVYSTARKIATLTDKPLVVCLSGGIDSEVVARAFIKNNIPFIALSLVHKEKTNLHDVSWAIKFCKENNIKHELIVISMNDFVTKQIPKYIDQGYNTYHLNRFMQIYLFELAETMGYTAVLGGGEQLYSTINDKINITYEDDFVLCLEWLKKNNKIHFPYFYMQNSEIFASYMKIGLIDCLLSDPSYFVNVINNTSFEKMTVYHKFWPEMARRKKYTGFENIYETELYKVYIEPLKLSIGALPKVSICIDDIKSQLNL